MLNWNWIRGSLDSPEEKATFASLKIHTKDWVLTRGYDRYSGSERDDVRVSLYQLAKSVADHWWQIFYEPRKTDFDLLAEARHSLDAPMRGFLFPPVSVWSASEHAVSVELTPVEGGRSVLKLLDGNYKRTALLPREEVEGEFHLLLDAIFERVSRQHAGGDFKESWTRIRASMEDQEEREYCQIAGRLGCDPYDPDSVNILQFSGQISRTLLTDVCDASTQEEFPESVSWARTGERNILGFHRLDSSESYGELPDRDYYRHGWEHGYLAARTLRQRLGLEGLSPRRVVDRIFGSAVRNNAPVLPDAPSSALEGLAARTDDVLRVAVPQYPARLRRSTLCRAAYLSWASEPGYASAITTAGTWKQQASRAFAAELLSPSEWLRMRAGESGLTPADVEDIATENVCPQSTILWQAHNHRIPLRGVDFSTL